MKILKKIIIALLILLIIAIISIVILSKNLQKDEEENMEIYKADASGDFISSLDVVKDYSTFFSVEAMLEKFINRIEYKDNKAIYSLLDISYIEEKSIIQENVLEVLSDINKYASKVKVRNIYQNGNANNVVYYIKCILEKEQNGKEFCCVINTDENNLTYSIIPILKESYENEIANQQPTIEAKVIEKNQYNKTLFINPTEEEIVTRYFEDFIDNSLYYTEYTYNLLETQYKSKCFPTVQDFQDYIDTKRESYLSYDVTNLKQFEDFQTVEEYRNYMYGIERLKLKQYQIRKEEGYSRYICIDSEDNYYIFNATAPLDYTVTIGNYVIPTEEFVKQYDKSSETQKIILNIKRFFMAIDDKNYGYSYSVLSEAFKDNKYPTKSDFVNYIKQNFFEENEIEYISYEKENELYIYKIKIKDATGNSLEEKELNIILKLNDGTDFEMSFGQ